MIAKICDIFTNYAQLLHIQIVKLQVQAKLYAIFTYYLDVVFAYNFMLEALAANSQTMAACWYNLVIHSRPR
jgi:hypothetical protein